VRIVVNTPVRKEIRPMVMKLIREATDSIVIEQIYMSDPEVIAALVKRSHEGVRVTVIIPRWPGFHYFSIMEAIARLITEGDPRRVQVFLYPRMIHGKIMLIDHSRLFIGSANLIPSSIDHMGEVNVLLEGWPLTVIHRMREVLKSDILISRPLTSPLPFRWIGKWLAALGL
jgi:phosphatidylserine/phosphatidylglycerophosphate/cardiolipin synthase-like enzyme